MVLSQSGHGAFSLVRFFVVVVVCLFVFKFCLSLKKKVVQMFTFSNLTQTFWFIGEFIPACLHMEQIQSMKGKKWGNERDFAGSLANAYYATRETNSEH